MISARYRRALLRLVDVASDDAIANGSQIFVLLLSAAFAHAHGERLEGVRLDRIVAFLKTRYPKPASVTPAFVLEMFDTIAACMNPETGDPARAVEEVIDAHTNPKRAPS